MLTFEVGDMAVYPAQGVAEVIALQSLEIAGCTNRFYVLRCLDSEKEIKVPVSNAERVGLRNVVAAAEIEQINAILEAPSISIAEPNWNRRYRRYVEKIQSGDLRDVALVLRDLHLTRHDKQLSYGERRVYETARQLVVQELAVAQHRTVEEVEAQVDELLGVVPE